MTSYPLVSVIMPVYNGRATLGRAIASVAQQTFSGWEIIAVDDGSNDDSFNLLQAWAGRDARIRAIRLNENRGASSARNAAIKAARGKLIAYLDRDDEYYPDYLEQIARHHEKGQMLIFGYDIVHDDGPEAGKETPWDPAKLGYALFARLPATPLGISHRRELADRIGGFNERLWRNEDWDFWKRAATRNRCRLSAAEKWAISFYRTKSLSRSPHLTPRQREQAVGNWEAGRTIFAVAGHAADGTRSVPATFLAPATVKKIAFVSPHCAIDFTNGAATATLDGLELLADQGFECQLFCSTRLDACEEVLIEEILARERIPYQVRNVEIGQERVRMIHAKRGRVGVTMFNTASTRGGWINRAEIELFLAACDEFLRKNRPDVVWTYGGDGVSLAVQTLVKRYDIPIVFGLHNFSYGNLAPFEQADYATVPSEFARGQYWEMLGLACMKLPPVIDRQRVVAKERQPEFVTFVNPSPGKGVFFFLRIASELAARRPDIRFLLVEGTTKFTDLPKFGSEFENSMRGLTNVTVMPNGADARQFYGRTRILLMPSMMETAGLVAAEAMMNGIPVVASNRGGLPETVGDAGILIDIPARYTPETIALPSLAEVEPWVQAIVELWDSPREQERYGKAGFAQAGRWSCERLGPVYRELFGSLTNQPGPPIVPREC